MPGLPGAPVQTFNARGMVKEVRAAEAMVVIAHEAIGDYMPAMTMPFKVEEPAQLVGIQNGQWVSFRLRVSSSEIVKPAATSHRPT
jgi:Cu/Ag efflux protein CusF